MVEQTEELEDACPHPWVRGENTSGGGNRCGLCGAPEPEGGFRTESAVSDG